ncbi:MAG: RidA family protein [Bdellovibrionales bacterium]
MKRIHESKSAPAPVGPYSQAVEVDGMLYCSGQISINPKTNGVFTGDIKEQAKMVMDNIGAVLIAADLDYSAIIKTTIFLTSMSDFAAVNEVYSKYFKGQYPARSTIAVAALPKGVNVEIEVIAKRG